MAADFEVRAAHAGPESFRGERKLEVVVLFTTVPATLFALRSAAKLADGLSARIRLVVPHVVPYPLAIDEPAIHPCVLSRRLCAMAHQAGVECANPALPGPMGRH